MANLKKAIKVSDGVSNKLDNLVFDDQKLFRNSIEKLENDIIDKVKKLKTNKGSLRSNKVNLKVSQKIHSELKSIFKDTYGKTSLKSVSGYNKVSKYIKESFTELDTILEFTNMDKTIISELKKNSLKTFVTYGLEAQEKIAQSMYNSILSRGKFSELVDSISSSLTGKLSKKGLPLSQYAEAWANDGLMNFHQAVTLKKGEDAGLDTFMYMGNIMLTTRDFCRRRVRKTYSKTEIESWTGPWAGKSGPALTNRGGYNCRHHWRPVKKSWVEEDIKEKKEVTKMLNLPLPSKVTSVLKDEELSIIKNGYESAVIVDSKTGKILIKKKGEKSSVTFSSEDIGKFKNNIVTHNHPSNNSFSIEDVKLAFQSSAEEMRVCTKSNIYRLRIHESLRGNKDIIKNIDSVYDTYYSPLYNETHNLIIKGKLSVEEANSVFYNKLWKKVFTHPIFDEKVIYNKEVIWKGKAVKAALVKKVPVKKIPVERVPVKKLPVEKEVVMEGFDEKILNWTLRFKGSANKVYSEEERIAIIKRRCKKVGKIISDDEAKSYADAINRFTRDEFVTRGVSEYSRSVSKGTVQEWREDTIAQLEEELGLKYTTAVKRVKKVETVAKRVTEYVENSVTFDNTQPLYRGGVVYDDIKNWEVGDDLTFSGTSSWSAERRVADGFAEDLAAETGKNPFVIVLDKGSNVNSSSLLEFSNYIEEKEVLLGRNSVFELVKKEPLGDGFIYYVKGTKKVLKQPEKLFQELVPRSDLSPNRDYYRLEGIWYQKGEVVSGDILEKLKKMAIPPSWKNTLATLDLRAKLLATGQDKVGKWQARYSLKHIEKKSIEKFNRVKLFSRDMNSILKNIEDGVLQQNPKAMLLRLENKTAVRVGTKITFKTKKKAYGLTTLKNDHVTIDGDTVYLDFIAKEGIPAHYEIKDDVLAEWLTKRKLLVGAEDPLFPDVTSKSLNTYLQKMSDGKKYTVKDFRTYHATNMAFKELKEYDGVTISDKKKKQVIKDVLLKVSTFLHNSPSMAKKSYINLFVWNFIGGY